METTHSTKLFNGIPVSVPNKISKDTKDFYVSYNNRDVSLYGSDTTALHINKTSQFLVLNGDHRQGYKNLVTLEECVQYFYNNIDKANFRSEHKRIFKIVDGKGVYTEGGY